MKKILTTFAGLLLAVMANAQTVFTADQIEKYAKEKYGDKWTKAAENLSQEVALDNKNRLNYQEVIECPGQSKDEIYQKALDWLTKAFSSKDTHGVIREQNKEEGLIVAQAYIEDIASQKAGLNHYQVDMMPFIRVDVKEERARLSVYMDSYEVTVTSGGGTTSFLMGAAILATAVAVASTSSSDKKDSSSSSSSSSSGSSSSSTSSSSSSPSSSSSSTSSSSSKEDDGEDEVWSINACYPFVQKDSHKKASSKAFVMASAFQNSILDVMKEALLAKPAEDFSKDW